MNDDGTSMHAFLGNKSIHQLDISYLQSLVYLRQPPGTLVFYARRQLPPCNVRLFGGSNHHCQVQWVPSNDPLSWKETELGVHAVFASCNLQYAG